MRTCPSCHRQNANREDACVGCQTSLDGLPATPEPPMVEWEQVRGTKDGNIVLERTRVPQGWLVAAKEPRKPGRHTSQEAFRFLPLVFVPDPYHEWLKP